MKRPLFVVVALAMLAIMASALWVGLSGLEHPVRVSSSGS